MAFIAGAGTTNVDLLYQGFERLADVGEELYAKNFSLQLGGGLPATLVNLGRLGIETKIITELGEDMFSGFAEEQFFKNGVQPININKTEGIPVNITSAIILPQDRTFYSFGRGNITPDDTQKELFYQHAKGSKITMMQMGGFLEVYKKLHDEGTVLVLDSGWDDTMSLEAYSDYLEIADYYTPNRKEAIKLAGESTPEKAAYKLKEYFDRVVVKIDKQGCIGIDDELFVVGSIEEFKCIDSTGAGDAFLAGFMYGLFYDYCLKDCILLGNITGGKSVTQVGALSGYLNESQLIEYYKKYKSV